MNRTDLIQSLNSTNSNEAIVEMYSSLIESNKELSSEMRLLISCLNKSSKQASFLNILIIVFTAVIAASGIIQICIYN